MTWAGKRLFGRSKQELMVSDTDVEAALEHLRALPHRPTLPVSWDRQRFLAQLREAIWPLPKVNQCYAVAPGVFAIVKPFGVDLAGLRAHDGRLQVWLTVRSHGTDPNRITRL